MDKFPLLVPGKTQYMGMVGRGVVGLFLEGEWILKGRTYQKMSPEGRTFLSPRHFVRRSGVHYEFISAVEDNQLTIYYWVRPLD